MTHHLKRKIPASLSVLWVIRNISFAKTEVVRQPVEDLAPLRETQGPHTAKQSTAGTGIFAVAGRCDLPPLPEVPQSIEEESDVLPGEKTQIRTAVRPVEPQTLGETGHSIDLSLDRSCGGRAPTTWNVIQSPCLRCLAQPRLGDRLEVQAALQAKDRPDPSVLFPFRFCR